MGRCRPPRSAPSCPASARRAPGAGTSRVRFHSPLRYQRRSTMLSADRRIISSVLAAILVLWFLLVLAGGYAGAFESGPTRPPLTILLAFLAPPLVFLAVYRCCRAFT